MKKKQLLRKNKDILWRLVDSLGNEVADGYVQVWYNNLLDVKRQLKSLESDLQEEHGRDKWLCTNDFMLTTTKATYFAKYNIAGFTYVEDHTEDEFTKTLPELKSMITAWASRNSGIWNVADYADRLLNEINEVLEGRDKT